MVVSHKFSELTWKVTNMIATTNPYHAGKFGSEPIRSIEIQLTGFLARDASKPS